MGPKSNMDAVPIRGEEDTSTQRRHREGGPMKTGMETGVSYTVTSQGKPRIASNHQKLEEARKDSENKVLLTP